MTGPDGSVKYFGDPNLKNRPNNPEAKKSWYARHAKSLKENPHFRAYARATWAEGGIIPAGFETMVSGDFNDPNMPQPQLFAKGAKVKEPVEEGGEGDLSQLPAGAYQTESMEEYVRRIAAENEAARQAAIAAAAAARATEERKAAEAFEAGRAAGQRQEEALMRPAPETLEGLEAVRAAELRDAAREEEARARFVPAGRDEASAQAVERIAELTPPIIPPSLGAFIKPYRDWETDRKSTRLNSSHSAKSRMPSSA